VRKDVSDGADGWKLVGERYVHGMVDGEVSGLHRVEVGEIIVNV